MKRILLFIFSVTVCLFAACSKKTASPAAQMTAIIDNRPWVSNSSNVTFDKTSGIHLTISADSATTKMKLDIGNFKGVGTYVISDSGNTASYTGNASSNGFSEHKATSGSIIVTSSTTNGTNENHIVGTFTFLAGTLQVTTGAFDVHLYLN